jgi:uncharacterized protein YecT (DUF1311 family)
MILNFKLIIYSTILVIVLKFTTLPSFAQESKHKLAQKVNCESPVTTLGMNICAGQEYKAADRKLNRVYRQLQSKLSGKQKQRLTNAQLVWIKFRDTNCNYERGQFEGGTMANQVGTYCLAAMTEKRTKELESYLQELDR